MTEISYYWELTTVGDAVDAPYPTNIYQKLWKILFTKEDNEGVVEDYTNELVVTGVSGAVEVATGAGLSAGTFYENTLTPVTIAIPLPVTDPRIDRIVLQKIWLNQTVRVARVAGTENASPTAPALTQTDGVQWETPLAQVLITTAGVITVTDEREFARTPLSSVGSTVLIETITSSGGLSSMDFQSIPQIYKHLLLVGNLLTNATSGTTEIRLNGDGVNANYNRQLIAKSAAAAVAAGNAGLTPRIDSLGAGAASDERSTQIEIQIANYINTTFFKNIIQDETAIEDSTPNNWVVSKEGVTWLDTSAITRVTLQPQSGATFKAGSQVSLYALR